MMACLLILTTLICGIGVLGGVLPLGIVFILSLVGYLYCFITLISLKLSELGIVLLVSNGIFLTYTSFYLFLGIDLLVKIGLK